MKLSSPLLLLAVILILSCGTGSQPVESPPPAEPVRNTAPAAQTAEETPPPKAAVNPAPEEVPVSVPAPEPAKEFNPESITEEMYAATKSDVQILIGDLNRIIRAKNYNAWRGYLADSYFAEISSAAFLADMTEELYKRDQIVASNLGRDPKRVQKKILRNPRDYFDNVVVPSRSNDHMDDIAFASENRVVAYTMDNKGNRLILYDLELIDNKWKIVN